MNKAKRESIIALITKLGYDVTEIGDNNRLTHTYTIKKDKVSFKLLLNKTVILVSYLEDGKQLSGYGLVLESGGNIADGKQHEHYKTLVDLIWEIRDLLNIQIPTIIL